MRIYIHAYMHTCVYTYMRICIHAYIHTCVHACMHAYASACMHAEALRGEATMASDMWALGVVVFMLLSGLSPFAGRTFGEAYRKITTGAYSLTGWRWAKVSPAAKEFVR
eukprot:GHVU01187957.1.p2 GENE.GHVU01187957.1~~GHVU01187957.1.p2  ORF type:complete len:110 (+),score=5.67 GHVU01187957.1:1-330(+)